MEFFEVGGCVRDEIMGVPSKDIDFTVVIEPGEIGPKTKPFKFMEARLATEGFKIFQSKPEFLTVRAKFPEGHKHEGVADFVLARKDGTSTDGRRPDFVEPGTLMDDLARRDFTMNAIAKDESGKIIDPFAGREAIANRIIMCVGSTEDRLFEDALRGLRAMRFAITKGFDMSSEIRITLRRPDFAEALASVSKERQREEMEKMFAHDTRRSIQMMQDFPAITDVVFSTGLRLSATMRG